MQESGGMSSQIDTPYRRSTGLVDVLDRVLDKGLVVAGDIRVSLAEVELLTIRIRLLVCSIDKAEQIGLDWWRRDPHLSRPGARLPAEDEGLRAHVRRLEERLAMLEGGKRRAPRSAPPAARKRQPAGRPRPSQREK
jgi:hypothetical protein